MLDCGNSRHKSVKKHCSTSRDPPSRRCIERDIICDLIDGLRYSGRGRCTDKRKNDRILDYIYNKRNSGPCETNKSHHRFMKFDGGNSRSTYPTGPIFDLGTSSPNLPEDIVQCPDDCASPANDYSKCHC